MDVYGMTLYETHEEEHSEIGASWMQGLVGGVLIGMFLIAAGIVLRISHPQSDVDLSSDAFIVGIPLFVICLSILTIWKKYSNRK